MGFWPFGGGKRQRVVGTDEPGRETLLRRTPSDGAAQEEYSEDIPGLSRTSSKLRRKEDDVRRLSKTRTLSSKALNYPVSPYTQPASTRPPVDTKRASRTSVQDPEKNMYQQSPLSQSSIGPENFTAVRPLPTLHAKRSGTDTNLPRRKSSKRKADDDAREKEIRALSSSPIPIPKRPATIMYDSGPLQRDSRHFPGAPNRRLERPTSEISLPLAGSLPDVYDFPNQNSFKVGILAKLSPRPTVRYDTNAKITFGKQPVRPHRTIEQAIAENDVSDKKRIDELADDLDSGGLRELMERDRKRRERKREAEKAKLQRRLQRRAERQREEEARRARTEAFVRSSPTATPRTPVSGVERSLTPKASAFKDVPLSRREDDPFVDPGPSDTAPTSPIRNPFEDEQDMDEMQDPRESTEVEHLDSSPTPNPAEQSKQRYDLEEGNPRPKPSQSTVSPPVSPVNRVGDRSSLSQASLLHREATPEVPESASTDRRASDQSSQRLGSWTTFFRRGTRGKLTAPKPDRTTPSEFSNTSRESFARKQPVNVVPRTFRRSDSGTPQRTLSRFREDLPELPISPPDSRIQSPETTVPATESVARDDGDEDNAPLAINISPVRDSSGLRTIEPLDRALQRRSVDFDVPTTTESTGMILSQSLASVDSEGSWLSGKPSKRQSSQKSHKLKPSQSSLSKEIPGSFDQGTDDNDDGGDDVMDDEYYKRLSSLPQDLLLQEQQQPVPSERRASSTLIDLKGEQAQTEEVPRTGAETSTPWMGDEKWHQGLARQPTLIRQAGRAKSNEGLVNEFLAAGESNSSSGEAGDDPDSDTPDADVKETSILRAKSVEYKKGHVRHISTGSGKLLDITTSSHPSDANLPTTSEQASDPVVPTEQKPSGPT